MIDVMMLRVLFVSSSFLNFLQNKNNSSLFEGKVGCIFYNVHLLKQMQLLILLLWIIDVV